MFFIFKKIDQKKCVHRNYKIKNKEKKTLKKIKKKLKNIQNAFKKYRDNNIE